MEQCPHFPVSNSNWRLIRAARIFNEWNCLPMLILGMPIRQPDERMRKILMYDAVIRVYEELRSAVSVGRYGTPASRVLAKLETPKWLFYGMATLRVCFCFGCLMTLA